MDVDPHLVRAVQRGDAGAMDALIRASYADVYALCRRLLTDPNDAADATQDVYVRVMRSVLGFRGQARFGTWLHRVTVNVCLTALKRRGDQRARAQSAGLADVVVDLPDHAADPATLAEWADLATLTALALTSLTDEARQIVVLRDVQGLSTKQAAQALGISEGAVKVRLHRAHVKLRELVGS